MNQTITGITGVFIFLLMMYTGCMPDTQKTYYISPEGNDNNTGLSKNTPWASIERVNRDTFQPGDAILFESGGTWYGQLRPQGSGKPGKPITLSSFGKGSKPVINMGAEEGVGIQLVNQLWWEIQGLEITSGAQPELGVRRAGITATVEGEGEHIEHIVIRDCYIHDVWGLVGGDKSGLAIYVGMRVLDDRESKNCTADDILVENNAIKRVDKVGIAVNGRNDVIVRGNYMENLGGDGIVLIGTHKGLIEYNMADRTCLRSGDPDLKTGGETWWPHTAAIWLWRCTETIMQFNEVYNTGRQPRNGDGMAYDFDYGCKKCILQYSYSANNRGGFVMFMDRETNDNIARYNISQNDQTHLIYIHGKPGQGNLIHNNVFYVDHSTVDIDYHCGREGTKDIAKLGANFKNNIFYAGGQGRFRIVYSSYTIQGGSIQRHFNDTLRIPHSEGGSLFQNNCYFGPWLNRLPDDPEKQVADPMLVLPGSGGTGLSSLDGYMLKPGSPCIDAGVFIEMDRKRDFFNNPVKDGAIDIGTCEYHSL